MKTYSLNDFLNATKTPKYTFSDLTFDFTQITAIKELANGGVGYIYKINFNDQSVCIKFQHKDSSFKKFEKIYALNKDILDEYAVHVYEIGSILIDKRYLNYTIMEYIPYQTLNKHNLNNKEVASLIMFLLQFMNMLHTNNMSYSDIKPENIVYIPTNMVSPRLPHAFKVIDIDTLLPLIPDYQEVIYNTTTDYFNVTNTIIFSSHQLSQLASCVYTCLDCMHIYPKCSKVKPIYQYENYLLNLAKYLNITNANQITSLFGGIYEYIFTVTNNELYTLLSIFILYILLIPKYTIAYIDTFYWYNIFSWYRDYLPETSKNTVELCNKDNLEENMPTILAIGVKSWTSSTDPELEISKIPVYINTDVFQQVLPSYVDIYRKRIEQLPATIRHKYSGYIQQDEYSLLRQDPRTTYHTPLYKRI